MAVIHGHIVLIKNPTETVFHSINYAVVWVSDLQPRGRRFWVPATPLHVTILGKLFTHNVPLFTKQYKLVPAIRWEGNRWSGVALAMRHRLSGKLTNGLNGLGKGDEHLPKLHSEHYGSFTFTERGSAVCHCL